jgi:hypothetical protein
MRGILLSVGESGTMTLKIAQFLASFIRMTSTIIFSPSQTVKCRFQIKTKLPIKNPKP